MAERPSGTVTFLFTDVVGSTKAWERDRRSMEVALGRHDAIIDDPDAPRIDWGDADNDDDNTDESKGSP